MSEGFDNTNRGAMFKNDNKRDDRSPDYRGSLNVDGTDYWISGWVKTAGARAKNPGAKFLSISVQTMDEQGVDKSKKPRVEEKFDDDIPF